MVTRAEQWNAKDNRICLRCERSYDPEDIKEQNRQEEADRLAFCTHKE
jgi:hypothetical protein